MVILLSGPNSMDKAILSRLLRVEELPSMPQVLHRIMATLENERSSAGDLTAILEKDPAISTRVLRLANSAFYGLTARVDSIRRAVVVLGFDAVRQLALATAVFGMFSGRRQFALDPEDFWLHSLGAAKAGQLLALDHVRLPSPEGCFTVALLHDIGKYCLALAARGEYAAAVQEAQDNGGLLRDVEQRRFETDHAEVGAWVARRWRFPPLFAEVIDNLYTPERYDGVYRKELIVTVLADRLSRRAGFGHAGDGESALPAEGILQAVGLARQQLEDFCEDLAQFRGEARDFLRDLVD